MASLSLYPQLETNLMSDHKAKFLQLKSAKAHGKNYIKVKPHLFCHLVRNRLLFASVFYHKRKVSPRPQLHGYVFKSFRFHFVTFSNRSTLDCVFKCLRFHDRCHRLCVNRS